MRQIDNMNGSEIETLRVKGMLSEPRKAIDKKRIQIQRNRIDACDTILDYLHDDIPWSEQQPLMEILRSLKLALEDEMEDNTID